MATVELTGEETSGGRTLMRARGLLGVEAALLQQGAPPGPSSLSAAVCLLPCDGTAGSPHQKPAAGLPSSEKSVPLVVSHSVGRIPLEPRDSR